MNSNSESKIAWTSGIGALVAIAAYFGYIPPAVEPYVVTILSTVVLSAIFVMRVKFTGNKDG